MVHLSVFYSWGYKIKRETVLTSFNVLTRSVGSPFIHDHTHNVLAILRRVGSGKYEMPKEAGGRKYERSNK